MHMPDFADAMANPAMLNTETQVKAGTPTSGDMTDEQKQFAETVAKLLESGEIDVTKPESFFNKTVYEKLDEEWKTKTDLALSNIATLLKHIYEFYRSEETPDACPQLAHMIEELHQMKNRIEAHADVFKF